MNENENNMIPENEIRNQGQVKGPETTENSAAGGAVNPTGGAQGTYPGSFSNARPASVDYSIGSGQREFVSQRTGAAGGQTFTGSPYNGQDRYKTTAYSSQGNGQPFYGREGNTYGNPASGPSIQFTRPEGSQFSNEQNNNGAIKEKKPKKERTPGSGRKVMAIALTVALSAAAGFGGGAAAVACFGGGSGSTGIGGSQTIKIDDSDAQSLNAASVIAEKVMPSVVGISTVSQTSVQTFFGVQQGTQKGVGTGFIISEDGYILTNSHVVNDGNSQSITIDLYDGSEYTGTVLWNSAELDLAIVKIDAKGLTAVELGDSDQVKIGDYTVAIGNPLGLNFERSVTQGIISGLDRTITVSDSSTGATNKMEGLIQTDASINSGNSGGPLINSSGQIIGINSAKAKSGEGLGFAIPINTAIPIINEVKENGTYQQSYMGISGISVENVRAQYEVDFNAEKGVYLSQIYTNSPASAADLREGDIITEINGEEIEDMDALKKELVKYRPGDTIKLTIERDKKNQGVELTLASESESTQTLQPSQSSSESSSSGSSGNGSSGNNGSNGSGSYTDPFQYFNDFFN